MSTLPSPSNYWGRDPNQAVWKPIDRGETLYLGSWNWWLLLEKPKGFLVEIKIPEKADFFSLRNHLLVQLWLTVVEIVSQLFILPALLTWKEIEIGIMFMIFPAHIPDLYTLAKICPTHFTAFSLGPNVMCMWNHFTNYKVW